MSANYKTWCRLCGDLNAQILDDENLLDVVRKFIDVSHFCQYQVDTKADNWKLH